MSNQTEDSSV